MFFLALDLFWATCTTQCHAVAWSLLYFSSTLKLQWSTEAPLTCHPRLRDLPLWSTSLIYFGSLIQWSTPMIYFGDLLRRSTSAIYWSTTDMPSSLPDPHINFSLLSFVMLLSGLRYVDWLKSEQIINLSFYLLPNIFTRPRRIFHTSLLKRKAWIFS